MPSIDDFIQTPLICAAGIALLLIILLIVIKVRNTCKASLIFYFVALSVIVGSILTLVNGLHFYFTVSVVIAELLAVPYLILKAFDVPRKLEEKNKKMMEMNRELTAICL